MKEFINKSICEGCGVELPAIEGPIHAYAISSPACWKMCGEVLTREYSNSEYAQINRLTSDAYAIQHPGFEDPRAIQSVSVHLLSLYLIFEKNYHLTQATQAIDSLIKYHKNKFIYLERPNNLGSLTIYDVWKAKNIEEHIAIVKEWAKTAYDAWSLHKSYLEELANQWLKSR